MEELTDEEMEKSEDRAERSENEGKKIGWERRKRDATM